MNTMVFMKQLLVFLASFPILINAIEIADGSHTITKLSSNASEHYILPAVSKKTALVLFWTACYGANGSWDIWFPDNMRQEKCPNLPCYYTTDRNLVALADAVVFHGFHSIDPMKNYSENFPSYRNPNQRWVFVTSEVPQGNNFTAFDGIFNWTMTYRRDSSILMHYGRLILRRNKGKNDTSKNYATGKTKLATMFNSHCITAGQRELYVEELQQHMPVDVYGACGPLKCGGRHQLQQCIGMVNKYKFFLSFENSICKDYVTEKLIKILAMSNVIPIVYGGADYEKLFPEKSYINALSFRSPKDLAAYIQIVDKNDTLYNEYFNWKRGYDVEYMRDFQCDFCQKLLNVSVPKTTIENFHDWWVVGSECTTMKNATSYNFT